MRDADTKQKTLCEYCHMAVTNDADHPVDAGRAEIFQLRDHAHGENFFGRPLTRTPHIPNAAPRIRVPTSTATHRWVRWAQVATAAATPSWYSAPTYATATNVAPTTMNCAACHNNVTADTRHTVHTQAATAFGIAVTCARCHEAQTSWGTSVPPTYVGTTAAHMNGTFALSGSIPLTYTGGSFRNAYGGCGTNNCHNSGKNGAPRSSAYVWGTAIANCTECHGNDAGSMTTQSHSSHVGTTTGGGNACTDCHAAATTATHINQSITFASTFGFTYLGDTAITGTGFGTCGTNGCHNDGKGGAPITASYTWGTTIGGTNTCTECHNAPPSSLTTQSHGAHLNTPIGGGSACTDCHPAATATTHADRKVDAGVGTVDFYVHR